jgi:hypothetical protein
MATCPKGHASETEDYCSECGALMSAAKSALAAASPAAPAAAAGLTECPACHEPRAPGAKFCGVCRYNFETGQAASSAAPAATPAAAPAPPTAPTPAAAAAPPPPAGGSAKVFLRWRVQIMVDKTLCTDPAQAAKAPSRPARMFPLDLPELLVGRRDERRGIHPEIEPEDIGISRRHLQFVRQADGSFQVVDLNSTNGTRLNGHPIEPGVPAPVTDGDAITLGAWTRITVQGVAG